MFKLTAFTLLAMAALITGSFAESEWRVTTQNPGPFPLIEPVELTYNISWNGVLRAGEATLVLGAPNPENPDQIKAYGKARSSGIAKKLWYYKTSFNSFINRKSLRPVSFEATQYERKEMSITTASFNPRLVQSLEMLQKRGSDVKKKGKEREFTFGNTYDLLSSIFYLRSLPLADGDEMTMVVFPLTSPYLAEFKVLGREKFTSGLGETDAIRLEIRLQKIKKDLTLGKHEKFKEATIWVSDDEWRVPLEIRTEIFVGSIRTTLEKLEALE